MGVGRPDYSFSRVYRLASSEDFSRVYRLGRRGRTGPFAWFTLENNCRHSRLGLVVPKRVVKRATDRSRVKRLIRESFRYNRSKLLSVDIVVSVRKAPGDLYEPLLNKTIERIWEEASTSINDAP